MAETDNFTTQKPLKLALRWENPTQHKVWSEIISLSILKSDLLQFLFKI